MLPGLLSPQHLAGELRQLRVCSLGTEVGTLESALKIAKYSRLLSLCEKSRSGFRLHCLDGERVGWKEQRGCAVMALTGTAPALLTQPSPAVPEAAV